MNVWRSPLVVRKTEQSTIHNHLIVPGILRNCNPWIHHGEYEDHINSNNDGIEEEASDRAESFLENMEVEIANFIEIQEGDSEEITLVRDDVEPNIIDADIVDANVDDNDENDKDVVSEDDEDDFSDRKSDIHSFDRDLEEDVSDDNIANASFQVVVSQNQPLIEGDIIPHDMQPPLSYRQKRRAQQALWNACKHGPIRGLKSLRKREQKPNVKAFAKITPDMECVIGKNANRFMCECSKWVKEFCLLDSRMDKDAKTRLFDKINIIASLIHPQDSTQYPHDGGAQDPTQQTLEVPAYVQLWEMTKRYKDRSWDPKTVANYKKFKELHLSQIEKEGADNLSLKVAYLLVMKEKSGYHRGLRPSPQPFKKGRAIKAMRVKVAAKIQQSQQKEVALQGQVGDLLSANSELKAEIERMKSEAIGRDNKLKKELIERERDYEHKKETIEREEKIRPEVVEMLLNLNHGI
ncbi:hypothetical protein Cgig2_029705 [Carnegiea gigantea]|uniref:Uncharacterized protein n=1 Tax=Carnegiea gigantea TaxID=171969 RepID=A0A9Q1KJA8_9CARY|nr:hypothetical protein Cgig2_029705 [Carnegiea gigantea]